MSKLDEMKKEYENICATDEFREKMIKEISHRKGSYDIMKKVTGVAAGFVAAFMIVFNSIPSLAIAASEVPVLGQVVKVATFGRFEKHDEKGYDAEVSIPQVEGLLDKDLQERLNKDLKDNADTVIAAFEKDVAEMKKEFGDENAHYAVTADYTIKTNNDKYLSIDTFVENTQASTDAIHKFYTVDKTSGKLLTFESLFKDGIDYVTPVSEYLKNEMLRQNKENNAAFIIDTDGTGGFSKIDKDQNFYIDDENNIVICFDKYEVASGSQGSPEIKLPHESAITLLK